MSIEIIVPDLGDDGKFPIIEVLVSSGDTVAREDGIILLESDKASMEVPAPADGQIVDLTVVVGDEVGTGDVIGTMSGEASGDKTPALASASASAPESAEPVVNTASADVDVVVPDLGDDGKFPIIEVLVSVGEAIDEEAGLVVLESDKATMEVPAPVAGVLKSLRVNAGDEVGTGDVIGVISSDAGSPAASNPLVQPEPTASAATVANPAAGKLVQAAQVASTTTDNGIDEKAFREAHASPSIRKLARELGADLGKIAGSGRKNRITEQDVKNHVKAMLSGALHTQSIAVAGTGIPAIPAQDFSKFGSVEAHKLSKINKLTGEHMTRCWLNIPHVTQFDEADITDLELFRKSLKSEAEKRGTRVTMLAFLMKIVAAGLKAFPRFNSSLSADGESLIMKHYFNIGIAVDTPNGLVVPVIKDVDQKSIYELSEDLMAMSKKAREGKLTPADMSGGSISISSLGGIGGTAFTPIVNAPEVAILGVSRSKMAPVWNGSEFVPRNMLPLSLSYDHRVIDGADGARFTRYLATMLEDFRRVML